ncbi:hypothetical protein GCM10027059_25900 [Myceligenerans halotolerans]
MPALLQSLPPSAEAYGAAQRAEIGAAVAALLRVWRRMSGDDLDDSWLALAPRMLQILDLAQERVTAGSLQFIPTVLDQTGQTVREPEYAVAPATLAGTAGDGRPTESLMYGAVTHTKTEIAAGATITAALAAGGKFLTTAAGTVLSDTGRTAEKMVGHSRHVTRYVRMLSPPSCGRCIQLAGESSARTAFQRHPRCDCRSIPVTESVAGDFTVHRHAYLDSLDDAQLAKALGSRANARAYRDGADFDQLINAYRKGVRSAQVYSERITYTTEGTTVRGVAFRAMDAAGLAGRVQRTAGERYRRATSFRLMPETIYSRAATREQALSMLRTYGWLRPDQPIFRVTGGVATRVR